MYQKKPSFRLSMLKIPLYMLKAIMPRYTHLTAQFNVCFKENSMAMYNICPMTVIICKKKKEYTPTMACIKMRSTLIFLTFFASSL